MTASGTLAIRDVQSGVLFGFDGVSERGQRLTSPKGIAPKWD